MSEEQLKEIIYKNPFAKVLGMEILKAEEGTATGRMTLSHEYLNFYEGMHGGCIYALADTVAGTAALTNGKYVATVNGSMNFLLPVKDSQYVYCSAKRVRQGKKIGFYDVEITGDEGQLFANGSFTYYVLPKEVQ